MSVESEGGWYEDPGQPGSQRYWDGTAWTEHRRPAPELTPAPPPPSPERRRRGWRPMTWVIVVFTVLMFAWMIGGGISAGSECDEVRGAYQGAKQSGCEAGTAIGVGLIFGLWFMGFVVLSLIWFMTRKHER